MLNVKQGKVKPPPREADKRSIVESTGKEKPVPDFSARMLKGFLFARMLDYRYRHDLSKRSAMGRYITQLKNKTGLRRDVIERAMKGELKSTRARYAIWCALDRNPASFGVKLISDGKQESISDSGKTCVCQRNTSQAAKPEICEGVDHE